MEFSINDFVANPYKNSDHCYNFFDWFCPDRSLERRAISFIAKLKWAVKEGLLNGDTMRVWFKNNAPMIGGTYDDMRFSSIKDDTFLGGMCASSPYKNGKCNVWYFEGPNREIVQHYFKSWSDFKKKIKNDPEFKKMISDGLNGKFL